MYNDPIMNPYDPDVQDQDAGTPPLSELIRMGIKQELLLFRVMLPAMVIKKHGDQLADIQPLLKTRYSSSNTPVNLPPIYNVPVGMPMGNGYSIKVPFAVGDTGYALFCDRSLDAWMAGDGNIMDPQDSRMHDIADPIWIPGMVPSSKQTNDNTDDMVLTNGSAVFRLKKSGKFRITNGSYELIQTVRDITQQLESLSNTLSTDTVNTMLGPQPLNASATYASISAQLSTLKAQLDALKG